VSDFSATTTNEKYIAGYSGFTTTDEVEVIGRFAATLSAGAGYTWTVPTFTAANLIQRPIYETRWLDWTPTVSVSGGTVPTYTAVYTNRYRVTLAGFEYKMNWVNTSGGTAGAGANPILFTFPFVDAGYSANRSITGSGFYYNTGTGAPIGLIGSGGSNSGSFLVSTTTVTGALQNAADRMMGVIGRYQI
jgi:hypothetical protein